MHWCLSILSGQLLNQLLEWSQLFSVNEVELLKTHRKKKTKAEKSGKAFNPHGQIFDSFLKISETLYLNEKDEVFEGCVEVGLLLQLHDGVKVLVVDVSIDPEQAFQNGLRHGHEVALKGNALEIKDRSFRSIRRNTLYRTCMALKSELWTECLAFTFRGCFFYTSQSHHPDRYFIFALRSN